MSLLLFTVSPPPLRVRLIFFLLLLLLRSIPVVVTIEPPVDLSLAAVWAPLNAMERANLYLAAAGAGQLPGDGQNLPGIARVMDVGEFQYDDEVWVRGARARVDLPAGSVIAVIEKSATIRLDTVVPMLLLGSSTSTSSTCLSEMASLRSSTSLLQDPADERALLALLLLRESERRSSPLQPYLWSFLDGAHLHVPSSWDQTTEEGQVRRAGLQHAAPTMLRAADELRRHILERYQAVVPRAIEEIPHVLGLKSGSDNGDDGSDNDNLIKDPRQVYSIQRFVEMWLALRSRSFGTNAGDTAGAGYGVILPVVDLMNHHQDNNVEVQPLGDLKDGNFVMMAKRSIAKGEQMTTSYGARLTAERALLVYGFPRSVWSTLPSDF